MLAPFITTALSFRPLIMEQASAPGNTPEGCGMQRCMEGGDRLINVRHAGETPQAEADGPPCQMGIMPQRQQDMGWCRAPGIAR